MKYRIILLATVAFLASCSSNETEEGKTFKRYKIEKAQVEYSTNIMGVESKSTLYFKDYGRTECTDSKAFHMGQNTHSRRFIKDGYAYTLDMINKVGSKMKVEALPDTVINPEDLDFDNIPPGIQKKYKIQKVASETFLGKECKVFSMKTESGAGKQTIWVWKNIPLKIEFVDDGFEITTSATNINEKPSFAEDVFELPADFNIIEYQPDSIDTEPVTEELPT